MSIVFPPAEPDLPPVQCLYQLHLQGAASGHLGQLYCGKALRDRPDFDHTVRDCAPLHGRLLL